MANSKSLVTLITGANTGIGYFTARHLARKGNFKIIIGSRSLDKAKSAVQQMLSEDKSISPESLEPIEIDLTKDETIAAAVQHIEQEYGYLDILINNAAIAGNHEASTMRQLFIDILNTNAVGTYLVIDAFVPLLQKSTAPAPARRIVNVSSGLGSLTHAIKGIALQQRYTPYSVSKAALNMINIYTMQRLKDDKIAVVAVSPGFCGTKLNNFQGPKSPEDGALNLVYAATHGDYDSVNAKFFNDDGKEFPW